MRTAQHDETGDRAGAIPGFRPDRMRGKNGAVLVEIEIECPHCGEVIVTTADTSEGDYTTIEDCQVCCAPMTIQVVCEPGRVDEVRVTPA
jgi:hypothetical protein